MCLNSLPFFHHTLMHLAEIIPSIRAKKGEKTTHYQNWSFGDKLASISEFCHFIFPFFWLLGDLWCDVLCIIYVWLCVTNHSLQLISSVRSHLAELRSDWLCLLESLAWLWVIGRREHYMLRFNSTASPWGIKLLVHGEISKDWSMYLVILTFQK